MKPRLGLLAGMAMMLVTTAGCAQNDTVATPGPSSLSPLLVPRVEGSWGGPLTLTGAASGTGSARSASVSACVTAAYRAVVGETIEHVLSVSRTGADLTATLVAAGTGLSCQYSGQLASSSMALNAATCGAPRLNFLCDDGTYQLDLTGSTLTASFDAPVQVTTMIGTAAYNYNVFLITPDGQVPAGTLVTNHRFPGLTRR